MQELTPGGTSQIGNLAFPYYTLGTLARAYEDATRQLSFLTHDPGVAYRRRRQGGLVHGQ